MSMHRPGSHECDDHFIPIRALELAPDDVILVKEGLVRVTSEPETVHRGLSLFDEFELLVGLRVLPIRGKQAGDYLILAPDEVIPTLRGGLARA